MRPRILFRKFFNDWLDSCLGERIPGNVRALSFSISQRELCFRVELNGTSEFNRCDTTWTWSECWSPQAAKLSVPTNVCRGVLENCNDAITTEILDYVREGNLRQKLFRFEGIAVESIDERYELVWVNDFSAPQKRSERPYF